MEELRDIKVTIEVETNKRSIQRVITAATSLTEAGTEVTETLSEIKESIYG